MGSWGIMNASPRIGWRAAGGRARFELLHGVPGDGYLLRLYPDRWRPIADRFLASLNRQRP
jgi:hypothetical protein